MIVMADKEKSSKANRLKRSSGPWLRMTDSEYAFVRRAAKSAGKTIAGYVRNLVLKHELPPALKQGTARRLRDVGKRLNRLVRNLHIARKSDDQVLSYGRPVPGKILHDEVTETLGLVEQELLAIPLRTWVETGIFRGGRGGRRRRGVLRMTSKEHAQVRGRAGRCGISQSAYLRAVALGYPLGNVTFADVILELEYLNNNLRQLQDIELGSAEIAMKTHQLIDRIEQQLNELASGKKQKRSIK